MLYSASLSVLNTVYHCLLPAPARNGHNINMVYKSCLLQYNIRIWIKCTTLNPLCFTSSTFSVQTHTSGQTDFTINHRLPHRLSWSYMNKYKWFDMTWPNPMTPSWPSPLYVKGCCRIRLAKLVTLPRKTMVSWNNSSLISSTDTILGMT